MLLLFSILAAWGEI
jgi:hypothetical protein